MVDHVRLGANLLLPWILAKNNDFTDCSTGIQCSMIKYLAKSLNFTFELINEYGGQGYQLKNGTWTGILGRIVNQQADMSASPITIRLEPLKQNIVDFSHLYVTEDLVVLTSFDESLDLIQINIVDILDISTLSLFLTMFITLIFCYVLFYKHLLIKKERIVQRVSSVMLLLIGILFYQDTNLRKKVKICWKNYFLISAWLFCALLIYQLISTAILIAFSLKLPPRQIETIEELANSGKSFIVDPTFLGLNHIHDNILRKIIDKFEKERTQFKIKKLYQDNKWTIDTSYGKSAIFLYEIPLKMLAIIHSKSLKPNTKFRFIEERYGNPSLLSIASSTRLPKYFRRQINIRVSQYFSTGIFGQDLKMILSKSQPFFDFKYTDENVFSPITILNLSETFRLTLVVWSISFVILSLEIFLLSLSVYYINNKM